jgi:transposase-like protein
MKKCAFFCPSSIYLSEKVIKIGRFRRKSDSKVIQRYRCLHCKKSFSAATHSELRGQNKRRCNTAVYRLICSGVSQRRAAILLNINKITVVRKFRFMANKLGANGLLSNCSLPPEKVREIQFDHMETFEHTKLKPLSILVVVDKATYKILAAKACSSPAKGLLVEKSMKKYGKRQDDRMKVMQEIFREIVKAYPYIEKIESDKSPLYPKVIREHFPRAKYKQYKGRRGCVTGQGELKSGGYDPLFSLNQTCGMFRANMNRLFRRSWCTTKKCADLNNHLSLYGHYHNSVLTKI